MRTAAEAGGCSAVRRAWGRLRGRRSHLFPCICDPGRRASWGPKVALVLLHVASVGFLFLLDSNLIRRTREELWLTSVYLVLFAATLVQYFFTSYSSPGYVIDAMKAANVTQATITNSVIHDKDNLLQEMKLWFLPRSIISLGEAIIK